MSNKLPPVRENSQVFNLFVGEFVRILLTKDNKQTIMVGDNAKTIVSPGVAEGFLLEEDDEFYYLGLDPNAIYKVVSKNKVVSIEVGEEHEDLMQALDDSIQVPTDENGVN